ncbi:MAG: two-component system response regulator [Magnetococcales bacterium]|nr:two-component system response regulator [Magnetococcales bacterium]
MARQTILVVDDVAENVDILSGILGHVYQVKVALNGEKALSIAGGETPPDLILLDIMMPGMDGFEVCRRLKANPITRNIPVIFVTARKEILDESQGFDLGAADYVTKPIRAPIVLARVRTHLSLYNQNRSLEEKVLQRTEQLNRTRLEIIQRLGRAAEFRDNETGLHVIRVSHYARLLGLAAGLPPEIGELLLNAAPLHDVGKIGIPDRVLMKPGPLDSEEWAIMQHHARFGANIIGDHDAELLVAARDIALTHHEKWQGTGYPQGLQGEGIPLYGRIVAIADVFDAITSKRPYKKAWPMAEALELVKKEAGFHFDPRLAHIFLDIFPEIEKIHQQFAETTAHSL